MLCLSIPQEARTSGASAAHPTPKVGGLRDAFGHSRLIGVIEVQDCYKEPTASLVRAFKVLGLLDGYALAERSHLRQSPQFRRGIQNAAPVPERQIVRRPLPSFHSCAHLTTD